MHRQIPCPTALLGNHSSAWKPQRSNFRIDAIATNVCVESGGSPWMAREFLADGTDSMSLPSRFASRREHDCETLTVARIRPTISSFRFLTIAFSVLYSLVLSSVCHHGFTPALQHASIPPRFASSPLCWLSLIGQQPACTGAVCTWAASVCAASCSAGGYGSDRATDLASPASHHA